MRSYMYTHKTVNVHRFGDVNSPYVKIKVKIVYSVWQQCMLDSHNYNKTQIER